MTIAAGNTAVTDRAVAAEPRVIRHVAFASDARLAMPLGVALHSFLASAEDPSGWVVHLVSDGSLAQHADRLQELAGRFGTRLLFHSIAGTWVESAPNIKHLSLMTYARLALPGLLEDVGRVVYLDADVVVRQDLQGLHDWPLNGSPLGAVVDAKRIGVAEREGIGYCVGDWLLDESGMIINAGVLVMDLEAWRAEALTERAVSYIERFADRLWLADQDAICGVLSGRIVELPVRYNVDLGWVKGLERLPEGPAKREVAAIAADPGRAAVLHYTSRYKPWGPSGMRYVMGGVWHRAMRDSGWMSGLGLVWWRARWVVANVARVAGLKGMAAWLGEGLLR